jgi:hypothetical protein
VVGGQGRVWPVAMLWSGVAARDRAVRRLYSMTRPRAVRPCGALVARRGAGGDGEGE